MAKKARFFKVTIRNGHGDVDYFIPSHKEEIIKSTLNISANQKLMNIQHLGWVEVFTSTDDDIRNVIFYANIENKKIQIHKDNLGYDYLTMLFLDEVKKTEDYYF